MLTGHAEVPTALEAMRLGAYDYLSKPPRLEELHVLVRKAAEKARLRRENVALRVRLRRHEPMQRLRHGGPGDAAGAWPRSSGRPLGRCRC